MADPVLTFTDRGIYCPAGDFHIDPWRPVRRALITHGHSDHARWGMGAYLATHQALPVIRRRLGQITAEGAHYGEVLTIGDAAVSFHPAGHVPGSAQIKVTVAGQTWVVSGDYKTEPDGLAEAFEPVGCHAFITECTFGLPVFRWEPQPVVLQRIADWWAANAATGKTTVLGAYSFGTAQRLLAGLPDLGPILTHGAVEDMTQVLRDQGYRLPRTTRVTGEVNVKNHPGALAIAPPSALGSAWTARLGPIEEAFVSGWMAVRGIRRRRALGTGFVLSDHADWSGLNTAIRQTGASRVFVTHGYTAPFRHWLETQGYQAGIVETHFGDEAEADAPEQSPVTE